MNRKREIILASASPRRRELLEQIGVEFRVVPSFEEEIITKVIPKEVVKELALIKANSVYKQLNDDVVVIGADTIVACDEHILGKPKDEEDAFNMLMMIQGNSHKVYTGVAIVTSEKTECFAVETDVLVNPMTNEEIRDYINTKEPMDKAGAYGIQGKFAVYIKGIIGDYYNVMGFPLSEFHNYYMSMQSDEK